MNPEKQSQRWRIRPFYLWLFAGCVAVVVFAWGAAELRVRQLERGVWQLGEVDALKPHLWWLDWFSEKQFVSFGLRARSQGLLGDWNFAVVGDYELAQSYYQQSIETFHLGNPVQKALETGNFTGKPSEFSQGFLEYWANAKPMPLIEESDMAYTFPKVADEANIRFQLEDLDPVPHPEELNRLLYAMVENASETEKVAKVCDENRGLIEALWEIDGPYAPVEVGEYEHYDEVCDYVRLLLLDAYIAGLDGKVERQSLSNEAAYRLIGLLEDNRLLVTLFLEIALRSAALELMESGSEQGFVRGPATLIQEDAFDQAWRAEYQFYKEMLSRTLPDSKTYERRYRNLVLNRHLGRFRSIRDATLDAPGVRPFEEFFSEWMYEHREGYFRHRALSRAEGAQFAAALEVFQAETLMSLGWVNLGDIRGSIEEIRKSEEAWGAKAKTKPVP